MPSPTPRSSSASHPRRRCVPSCEADCATPCSGTRYSSPPPRGIEEKTFPAHVAGDSRTHRRQQLHRGHTGGPSFPRAGGCMPAMPTRSPSPARPPPSPASAERLLVTFGTASTATRTSPALNSAARYQKRHSRPSPRESSQALSSATTPPPLSSRAASPEITRLSISNT